jgi:hypothetical protein
MTPRRPVIPGAGSVAASFAQVNLAILMSSVLDIEEMLR